MNTRSLAVWLTFICVTFFAGYAVGGPAFWAGGGGGSAVSPSGTAAAGEVTYWTSPTAISGNTLMTYTAGTGVFALNTNGTAAAPVITMGTPGDVNTGLFHPAAEQMSVSTNGSQNTTFHSTVISAGYGGNGLYLSNVAPVAGEVGYGSIEVARTDSIVDEFMAYNAGGTQPGSYTARASRGTIAAPAVSQIGDPLGSYYFAGQQSGAVAFFSRTASINAVAAATFSGTEGGTDIVFDSVVTGSGLPSTRTEKMRIKSNGDIVPPSDNSGNIGTGALRWTLIRGVTITSGDIGFDDDACPICHRPIEEHDSVMLYAKARVFPVEGKSYIPTVPAHLSCLVVDALKRAMGVE